jgi:hypothetical protein
VLAVIESRLSQIPGILLLDGQTGKRDIADASFRFNSRANRETMDAVLKAFPVGGSLQFFDGAYPCIRDPGAVVLYWRATDGIQVCWGNPGWMSSVIPICERDASTYLSLCATWHMDADDEPCLMWDGTKETRRPSLKALLGTDPTQDAQEHLYLARRLAKEVT